MLLELPPIPAPSVTAWHPAMPINEGVLLEHRSEHQAPRRSGRTIAPDAVAEPPSERSVFGEPARRGGSFRKNSGKTGVWKVGLGSGAGRVR
jgi:hypothetical protein